jgi:hypothetical protein
MLKDNTDDAKAPKFGGIPRGRAWLCAAALGLGSLMASPAFAQTVNLKVLVISTGTAAEDIGLDYIDDVLDEMGVPYDVLDSSRDTLTAAKLATGTAGRYSGVILTSTDLFLPGGGSGFSAAEWATLQTYEKDFLVRESVLSGFPGTYPDLGLDYGMGEMTGGTAFSGTWVAPAGGKEFFEYINTAKPLPITDWTVGAKPRNDGAGPAIQPLLKAGDYNLVSILTYPDGRKVLLSTITNAWFLVHSQALAYEFINFATRGVFLGGRFVHMTAHLDDLFLADELWDPTLKITNPALTYRLSSQDIGNGISAQSAFRAAHPTAGNGFKLDHAFNGAGAVIDPEAATPVVNLTEDLVAAVVANRTQFRFINHTFSHADMDKPPVPANAPCDYPTLTTVTAIKQEITKNRTIWTALGLPERAANNRVLVSGNHSGLKDRKCTDLGDDPQADDIPYPTGANSMFLQALAETAVDYIASDSSQLNQNKEQYTARNRVMLPRWPTNVFFNVVNPAQLTDEYNYIFHDRFVRNNQDPCSIAGAICATRTYAEILAAEADTALRHMLSYKKWPHYFHQTNLANYGGGKTLQFDWLNVVFARYEEIFKLPVKNLPYYQIGDRTLERLKAKAATIQATWNLATNQVTLSANTSVPNVPVTGITGGALYGGQLIREITLNSTPKTFAVNRGLSN